MTHRSLHLLLTTVALAAAVLVPATPGLAQTAAPQSAPDNPAALPDQEIGRRFTVKTEDLPPPKTGPIVASRSLRSKASR